MRAREQEDVWGRAELERLPDIYRELVAVVGFEAVVRLARHLGGTNQYFPKFERVSLLERNRRIRAEFNGCNYEELARRYGVSTRYIRLLLRRRVRGRRGQAAIRQGRA